jgi:NADH-quinone oxidoreductase subunit A
VATFLIISFAVVIGALITSRMIAPKSQSTAKSSPYECGISPMGEPWSQFNFRYYIFALLFIIFDVETVFMYPWALVFKKLGWFAFWEMIIFILVLALGLLYAWKKKVLRWV